MEELNDSFLNIENKDDLKVLMLGGRRCGKTSVLASMFESIINGQTNSFLTVSDDTKPEMKGIETKDTLPGKTAELIDLLAKPNNATFLVDQKPSRYWWDYRLKIQLPGTNKEMFINFRDVPGEFCRQGNEHEAEVREYVKHCDVFVVVVDTPYMMEVDNIHNPSCTEGVNLSVNRIPDIQQYLTGINDNEGFNSKMVVFCPVKCERWYNAGRIDEVNEKLMQVYSTCITNLMAYKKMDISIIPILTAGNIEFFEQRDAYILQDEPKNFDLDKVRYKTESGSKVIRCCMQTSKQLRLSNGKPYTKRESDVVNEDPEAVIKGTNLARPYSWFKIRHHDDANLNGFKPLNCEQLPLHIIRFMLAKRDNEKTFWETILDLLGEFFGTIDPDELKKVLMKMQAADIIKDDVDGIVHLKKAY
jgi:hypothetical protein